MKTIAKRLAGLFIALCLLVSICVPTYAVNTKNAEAMASPDYGQMTVEEFDQAFVANGGSILASGTTSIRK